jgi:hypothetical protein
MTVIWQASPEGLEMEFFNDVDELLETDKATWYVTEGFRSIKRSNQLYAIYKKGGPRAAPGGLSPHNIGEAIDVVLDGDLLKAGLQMNWDANRPEWRTLFDRIKAHPRLHSGTSFNDDPHIESVKFARNKKKDPETGYYFIPVQNLHYLPCAPSTIRRV